MHRTLLFARIVVGFVIPLLVAVQGCASSIPVPQETSALPEHDEQRSNDPTTRDDCIDSDKALELFAAEARGYAGETLADVSCFADGWATATIVAVTNDGIENGAGLAGFQRTSPTEWSFVAGSGFAQGFCGQMESAGAPVDDLGFCL